MKKLINSSISPNLEGKDVLTALRLLFSPLSLKYGSYINSVESWFKYNFRSKFAFSFSSGREAEYALLRALKICKEDEVLVQAFTCVAVVNPILWLGAKPIFVDIDKQNLSMDIEDLKQKITDKTKVIILQHTFGIPAHMEEVKKICREKKIFLLEDCAHVIGGKYKSRKLGEWGDAAFFSFGRDKAISSVFGGIVVTNNRKVAERIKRIKDVSAYPSYFWICQQLMHPIVTFIVINGFNAHPVFGKIFLYAFKKIHLISLPIIPEEKISHIGNYRTRKFPNALAVLCFSQLMRLNRFNKNRQHIFTVYRHELTKLKNRLNFPEKSAYYLRIPIMVSKKEKLRAFCKENSIYLGDWYSHIIDPKNINLERIFYNKGSCKMAENVSRNILNLPCYPRMTDEDVKRVSLSIKLFYGKQ